jgi:hypothetical protein
LAQSFPDYTGLGLATMLEQELSMVESVKELLRLHDEMQTGIDSISAKIVKTEASRSANKFEQAAEQRIILEERQASLTAFYKGFIYFTLPCCARQRAASLRRLTSMVAAADLTSCYALQVACVKFFADIRYATVCLTSYYSPPLTWFVQFTQCAPGRCHRGVQPYLRAAGREAAGVDTRRRRLHDGLPGGRELAHQPLAEPLRQRRWPLPR